MRAGARSPIAAVVHAVVVLLAVLLLAPAARLPADGALAALLLLVAWNMSEPKHFAHMLRVAPRSDVAVLLTCFVLTVVFDMVIAVTVGVCWRRCSSCGAWPRSRRSAWWTGASACRPRPPAARTGVLLYEIAGPLFFGAAQKAMTALEEVDKSVRVVILDLRAVPVARRHRPRGPRVGLRAAQPRRVFVILGGVQPQPAARHGPRGLARPHGRVRHLPLLRARGGRGEKGLRVTPEDGS